MPGRSMQNSRRRALFSFFCAFNVNLLAEYQGVYTKKVTRRYVLALFDRDLAEMGVDEQF